MLDFFNFIIPYSQNWLNNLMNDHHFSYIPKNICGRGGSIKIPVPVGLTKESYGGWVGDLSHMENPTWWNSR
jgi:hypothetical protein